MLDLLWIPLLLQVVIPLVLLLWLALGRPSSRAAWVLTAVLAACYLEAAAAAGLWLTLPGFLPLLYGGLLLFAVAYSLRRARARPTWPVGPRAVLGVAVRGALALAAAAIAVYAYLGRRPPGATVDLAFPLRHGTFLVANGGSIGLLNAHLRTLSDARVRPYRGQSYGVDIVRVGARGMRARGFVPTHPAAYAIFGAPVYAPCAGEVVAAADGFPDMPPPRADRAHMAGNHVILSCGGAWIVLGHLQRGTVLVRAGDSVRVGAPLGRVGNSGNTSEPHLHIHAQRPGTTAAPLGGDPLPVRFDGRYLVRNARVRRAG